MRVRILLFASALLLWSTLSAEPSVYPTGVTVNKEGAFEGLTIFNYSQDEKAYLIDMEGNVVHEWSCDFCDRFYPLAKPLSGGRILSICGVNGVQGLCEFSWDGRPIWSFHLPGWGLHHDFFRNMATGNTLILANVDSYIPAIAPYEITDNHIYEITDDGTVVWSWKASDHFDELKISDKGREIIYNQEQPYADKPDIFHTNTIQPLPSNKHARNDSRFAMGNILVSQRTTGKVFIVSRDTGEIVWRLDEVVKDEFKPIGQHHTSMIPRGLPGEGNIILLDNGGLSGFPEKSRWWSRVLEVDPISGDVVWQYNATKNLRPPVTFFSPTRGSAQRLPNGNTLIVESLSQRIFEVTQSGEIVWEYVHPPTTDPEKYVRRKEVIYRAYRIGPGWGTTNLWPDPGKKRHFNW